MLQAEQVLCDRYHLHHPFGNNPGRQTWLAFDYSVSPPESVIIKLLAFNPQMQWDEFKLFEREAQVLQQLTHPQIPRYRDYFSLDSQVGQGLYWFGLVQQYIPGASLRQLLDQGKRFTQEDVKRIAESVLEILSYLHGLQPSVLHRDIKPSNLILADDVPIYLVDFGAVQNRAVTEGVTFTVVGTTGYTPLEQFWGRAVPASDLYALGATLIHLLTGITPADLPQQDLRIQWSDRVSVDPQLIRWIDVLTAPDLDARFSSAAEALEALHHHRYPQHSLTNRPQPKGSPVQLKKSPHQLSLKIPQPTRSFLDILKLGGDLLLTACSLPLLLLFGLIFLGLGIGLFATLSHNGTLFLVLLPLVAFLGWLWRATNQELGKVQVEVDYNLRHLFGCYCLYLTPEHFIIERELLGLTYQRHIGQLTDIKNIQLIPFTEIRLETWMISYSFGETLTENERRWLVEELQGWVEE